MLDRFDRRRFLSLTAAGIGGALVASWVEKAEAMPRMQSLWEPGVVDPDLVLLNARVYTVDPAAPRAEAFAIHNGKFVAIGTTSEIKSLVGKRTRTFDATNMTVVPGFTDCHLHALGGLLLYEVNVGNPFEVEFVTISSIIEKLRVKARAVPPGTWIEGYFFDGLA